MAKLIAEKIKFGKICPRHPELKGERFISSGVCRECSRLKQKKAYHANPKIYNDAARFNKYGLTREQYDELVAQQDGKCAVCTTNLLRLKAQQVCVDHDHGDGKIRGILCHHCNLAIGHMKDDPEIAIAAARYLNG